MRLAVVAVGQRLPAWAEQACADYAGRFPPDWKLELKPVKAEPRTGGLTRDALMAREADRVEAAVPRGACWVVLDERGKSVTTAQFAAQLQQWQRDAQQPCFVVGGADGLAERVKQRAQQTLRLSAMTLPHALARVLLLEQLYRACSLLAGHPYHRE